MAHAGWNYDIVSSGACIPRFPCPTYQHGRSARRPPAARPVLRGKLNTWRSSPYRPAADARLVSFRRSTAWLGELAALRRRLHGALRMQRIPRPAINEWTLWLFASSCRQVLTVLCGLRFALFALFALCCCEMCDFGANSARLPVFERSSFYLQPPAGHAGSRWPGGADLSFGGRWTDLDRSTMTVI